MLFTEAIGIESQSNKCPELKPFKIMGQELIEYLPYIYHLKMDSEKKKSYHHVKSRKFAHDNKNKCQKKSFFNSHFVSCFLHFFFRKFCWLLQIPSGRDGRASKSERPPIELTRIVLPILAALLLVQTNRLDLFITQSQVLATLKVKAFENHCVKRRKSLVTA